MKPPRYRKLLFFLTGLLVLMTAVAVTEMLLVRQRLIDLVE